MKNMHIAYVLEKETLRNVSRKVRVTWSNQYTVVYMSKSCYWQSRCLSPVVAHDFYLTWLFYDGNSKREHLVFLLSLLLLILLFCSEENYCFLVLIFLCARRSGCQAALIDLRIFAAQVPTRAWRVALSCQILRAKIKIWWWIWVIDLCVVLLRGGVILTPGNEHHHHNAMCDLSSCIFIKILLNYFFPLLKSRARNGSLGESSRGWVGAQSTASKKH